MLFLGLSEIKCAICAWLHLNMKRQITTTTNKKMPWTANDFKLNLPVIICYSDLKAS